MTLAVKLALNPNTTNQPTTNLKDIADNKINVTQKTKLNFVLGRVENIVEKGKNAGYQHFLLFPQFFQKASFSVSLTFSQTFLHFIDLEGESFRQ